MKGLIVSMIAVLALVQLMAEPGQAITCPEVNGYLATCLPYLSSGGGEPGATCCSGVRSLVAAAKSTEDKREACKCVKDAANRLSGLKDAAAQALPGKCGVTMDIPISKTVDCQSIS